MYEVLCHQREDWEVYGGRTGRIINPLVWQQLQSKKNKWIIIMTYTLRKKHDADMIFGVWIWYKIKDYTFVIPIGLYSTLYTVFEDILYLSHAVHILVSRKFSRKFFSGILLGDISHRYFLKKFLEDSPRR